MDDVLVLHGPPPLDRNEIRLRLAPLLAGHGAVHAFLIGSYARGEADAWSDIDLVVVMPTARPFVERPFDLADVLDAVPVAVDLLVLHAGGVRGRCPPRPWHLSHRRDRGCGAAVTLVSREEAVRWLAAAREDVAAARHMAAGGFHAAACFHAQQAAEKAVKAVHFARGARAGLGHSVRKLIEALSPSRLDQWVSAARELDLLYIPSRSPNGLQTGTPGEAFGAEQSSGAIERADAIVEAAAVEIG